MKNSEKINGKYYVRELVNTDYNYYVPNPRCSCKYCTDPELRNQLERIIREGGKPDLYWKNPSKTQKTSSGLTQIAIALLLLPVVSIILIVLGFIFGGYLGKLSYPTNLFVLLSVLIVGIGIVSVPLFGSNSFSVKNHYDFDPYFAQRNPKFKSGFYPIRLDQEEKLIWEKVIFMKNRIAASGNMESIEMLNSKITKLYPLILDLHLDSNKNVGTNQLMTENRSKLLRVANDLTLEIEKLYTENQKPLI